ncbi:unnamed protein product [Diabrotica balteata]|uniref:Glucose-methanol-choline oxidoreductase C-terminal domain-containing protein n=1 Tax=Diabrotica balteata TaxID=107213 RepID=A0A9N9X6W4_DIABA|nr:unnamed protein product [Diabrotica balteata]
MLSGVGPKKHLKEVNISLIQDLEVGSKSRDHIEANIFFSTNIVLPPQDLKQQLQDYLQGIGDLTSVTTIQGVAFYETENNTRKGVPNLEIFTDVSANSLFLTKSITLLKDNVSEALSANHTSGFSFGVIHTDPKSTGTIRLKSSNPFEYPIINPNLLSDPENKDIDEMYQSIQLLFKLAESKAYQSLGLNYLSNPLPDCSHLVFKSKEYWYCYLRQITLTAFHPMATCPMGRSPKKGAVVDSNLKVFGIKRLRVADASIFPISSTGHPSVPCIMIGEKISDYIKNHYP